MTILGTAARYRLLAVLVASMAVGAGQVVAEPDAAKSDTFQVNDEAAKLEAATSAPAKDEAVKSETAQPEPAKVAAPKEAPKIEAFRAEAAPPSPDPADVAKEAARDASPKAAEVPAPAPANATVAAAATSAAADPILETVRRKISDKPVTAKANDEDAAALPAFYGSRSAAVWIKDGAFNSAAKSVIDELQKADDWGLEAKAFNGPELGTNASVEAQADAEIKLTLAALKYARHARGGRVEPLALSDILDMKPPLKEPKAVLTEISESSTPDAYLRGLHPKHPEFEKLRQALLKARGHDEPEEKIDEALKIKLPETGSIKPGTEHADVALLRKRLKIEAQSGSNENLYDARLEAAVKTFQQEHELKVSGILNEKTRKALNSEGAPKKLDGKGRIDLILVNMERWRWLPEDLSYFYVMNNIPEFTSRVMKDGNEALKQKIIVGQPTWPTPVLAASMEFVIFHPEWGVPDGIKVNELLPRLKRASSQYSGGFFDQLFGGGSESGGARVLAAYKLNPTFNGRPVDANKIDWNRVDIKQFSFVQPAGAENPLGLVKFRFPNRHDVYMHDTPQKGLFGQSFRALSHGCMRLEQPRKMAEIILSEDKGWPSEKIGSMMAGLTTDVTLSKPVPVYVTYFTARVNSDGKLETYSDIYGHDSRLREALAGRLVRYNPPDHSKEAFTTAGDPGEASLAPTSGTSKKGGKKGVAQVPVQGKSNNKTAIDLFSNAFGGLLEN